MIPSQPFNRVTPPPTDCRRHDWGSGIFETARRSYTPVVEGRLLPTAAVVMVTLRGGADHHELVTDDGYRFSGRDRAGSTSFLPRDCGRRLTLRGVAWQWASITLNLDLLDTPRSEFAVRPFCADSDEVVRGILAEMERLHALDGTLDTAYCEAMNFALVQYLGQRYWRVRSAEHGAPDKLPSWRLRRVTEFIEENLSEEIRIQHLAQLVGVSQGHFYRAFRATTGQTPMAFVTARRIEAAKRILSTEDTSIISLAHRVGFISQSHFARTFRAATGATPLVYRQRFAAKA